ncbi:MAG: DUF4330 domain-containing protein [Bacillota bacterium]
MVFIDEHGRLFGRINIINLLAVLVLAGIVLVMIRYKPSWLNTQAVNATVVLEVANPVPRNFPDYLHGKSVWDSKSDVKIGRLAVIEAEPSAGGKLRLTLTVKGTAVYQKDRELRMGGNTVYLGKELSLKTDVCRFKARIISLVWDEQQN